MLLLIAFLSLGIPEENGARTTIDSLRWQTLPAALHDASREGRPVFLYVRAPWCGPCRRMENEVFPAIAPLLHRFALARLDFDDHLSRIEWQGVTQSPAAWARDFGAEATPSYHLLDHDGSVITRATGFLDRHSLGLLLAYVATGAYHHAPFSEYALRAGDAP